MVKCFDVASMVIDEFTYRNSGSVRINEKKRRAFKALCNIIDRASLSHEGSSYAVDVDGSTGEFIVEMTLGDVILESMEDPFNQAIALSNDVSFRCGDDEEVVATLRFDGIWDNA